MYNLTYRGSCKPNHQRISREPPANSLGIDYWNKKCDCSWLWPGQTPNRLGYPYQRPTFFKRKNKFPSLTLGFFWKSSVLEIDTKRPLFWGSFQRLCLPTPVNWIVFIFFKTGFLSMLWINFCPLLKSGHLVEDQQSTFLNAPPSFAIRRQLYYFSSWLNRTIIL